MRNVYNAPKHNGSDVMRRGFAVADYPSQYESELILRDGLKVKIRPIRPDDVQAWVAFISRLSSHSKYLRFHNVIKEMGIKDALRFCTVDYQDTFALVAEIPGGKSQNIIAIGRYARLPGKENAEFAIVVEDIYHGKGIATRIIECIIRAARSNGITAFEGEILAENDEMLTVLKDYGFHFTKKLDAGVYHVTIPI
jgi:acetyltransferase